MALRRMYNNQMLEKLRGGGDGAGSPPRVRRCPCCERKPPPTPEKWNQAKAEIIANCEKQCEEILKQVEDECQEIFSKQESEIARLNQKLNLLMYDLEMMKAAKRGD